MGYENRGPSAKEREQMKHLVAEAMDSGAVGMSIGLIYLPGCYAETDELIELAEVLAEKGGFYASHIRGKGPTLIEAVKEAIEISERASIPVEISHPISMIGTDASSRASYGFLGRGKPHPRSYGTHPRVIKRYCREKKILSLSEVVRKMASLPAQKLGLSGRGLLKEGMWADIVLFDKDQIADLATFQNQHQYPRGIEYVIVNGIRTVENGEHTEQLAGKILRKGSTRNIR